MLHVVRRPYSMYRPRIRNVVTNGDVRRVIRVSTYRHPPVYAFEFMVTVRPYTIAYGQNTPSCDPLSMLNAVAYSQPYLSGGAKWKNLPDGLFFPNCPLFLDFSSLFPDFFPLFPNFWQFFRCQGGTLPPCPILATPLVKWLVLVNIPIQICPPCCYSLIPRKLNVTSILKTERNRLR